MSNYSKLSKQASWALLVVTLLLAFVVFFAVGFVSFVGFIQHLMVPEKPWRFGHALGFGASALLPALFLARFYFVVAAKRYSRRYAVLGWSASACYHAAMAWLFLFVMPGTAQTSGGVVQLQFPLSLISAAAFCMSVYLVIRHPHSSHDPLSGNAA